MNTNTAETVDVEKIMERNRAANQDAAVFMISRARHDRDERARMIAEAAAKKTIQEADRRREKAVHDPDVFVKLIADKPVKFELVQNSNSGKPSGFGIGSIFAGYFAGVLSVIVALIATGIL